MSLPLGSPGKDGRESGEPLLVETGAFRMDRAAALRKLKAFRIAEPYAYLLPWVRCAKLSGAPEIRFEADAGLSMSFAGLPLSLAGLEDPYCALLDEDLPDAPRLSRLAVGLLTALRTRPSRITVVCGRGSARRRLVVSALDKHSLSRAQESAVETLIELAWPGDSRSHARNSLEQLRLACRLVDFPILVQGKPLGSEEPGDLPQVSFDEEGFRGTARVPAQPGAKTRLRLYQLGVLAGELELAGGAAEAEIELNGDALRLNVSESGVVQDEAYAAATALVPEMVERLVRSACLGQSGRYEELGRTAAEQGFSGAVWRGRFRLADGRGWLKRAMTAAGEDGREGPEFLRWEAVAAWLREAAVRALAPERGSGAADLAGILRETGLFLSVAGKPLCLRDIDALQKWLGYLPASRSSYPDSPLPVDPVWCPTGSAAACLERLFPKRVQWLTDLEVCRGPLPGKR